MLELLDRLNNMQRQAVEYFDGPLLILAGAGSGKTTVLVNKIAYMISQKNIRPYNVLSITFTNKAANEMKVRIENMVGEMANDMWIGTFHSICVRILRRTIDKIGFDNNFVIYDTTDTSTVVKECMKELNINDKNFPPRAVQSVISNAKDDMLSAEDFENRYASDFRMSTIAKIYTLYQRKLKSNNALDFDDIINYTVKIFKENPEILEQYRAKFKYILVDEYQDTNNVQYTLVKMLAQEHQQLCVVGDDDQSIYKFRGANIRNILDFEKDFSTANVIKLEQNYRSTQNILDAANFVIKNNKGRKGKSLWTQNNDGDKIRVFVAAEEHEEGRFIAKQIAKNVANGGKYSDSAILFRTNAQSRVLEEMLLREAIPYRVLSGLRFYDRKEIKDIIAYLRVLQNPHDDISLKRIINEPKRNIGAATIEKAQNAANEINTSIFAVISVSQHIQDLAKSQKKLNPFVDMINSLIAVKDDMSVSELINKMLDETGYMAILLSEKTVENESRIENIKEFMSVVKEHEATTENADLSTFLESVSLVSDIDSYDEEQDAVVLMTIHSAKGLEFPNVFLAGLEEGVFPGMRSISEPEEIEEERRLCYVAITRAKKNLYITRTERRTLYGSTTYNPPSRFLKEIPTAYIDEKTSFKSVMSKPIQNTINNKFGSAKQTFGKSVEQFMGSINSEKTSKTSAQPNFDFKVGDAVMHKKFGRGLIISVQPIGYDVKLEIAFDSVGTRNLMAAFAKLEKL